MTISSLPVPDRMRTLKPYVCARHSCKGDRWTFLDANESPVPLLSSSTAAQINRYPDPTADVLRQQIGAFYGVSMDQVIVGNGCDELISLCVQTFARPSRAVMSIEPTYGMYRVCADTYGIAYKAITMENDCSIDLQKLQSNADTTDVLFLCTPNSPTGNILPSSVLQCAIEDFPGLVVIDEAYGEFADASGIRSNIQYVAQGAANVIVLRTFSKAFGAAGIRLGYGIADTRIIEQLQKVKMPYNVNALSQEAGEALWQQREAMEENVRFLQKERVYLQAKLEDLGCSIVESVTNFFLMQPPNVVSSDELYTTLRDKFDIVLRNFGPKPLLKNKLRVTVGTREQNDQLLSAISSIL